jgi:hypothetical protein
VDLGSEACLFVDGSPRQGLTDSSRKYDQTDSKRQINLFARAKGGEKVDLLLEAGANSLFGYHGRQEFTIDVADIAIWNRDRWLLSLDLEFLYRLMETLPETSVRGRRLLVGLNDAANAWRDGDGAADVAKICADLLKPKAAPSATTAWSGSRRASRSIPSTTTASRAAAWPSTCGSSRRRRRWAATWTSIACGATPSPRPATARARC